MASDNTSGLWAIGVLALRTFRGTANERTYLATKASADDGSVLALKPRARTYAASATAIPASKSNVARMM
jgi:hypothetical protein